MNRKNRKNSAFFNFIENNLNIDSLKAPPEREDDKFFENAKRLNKTITRMLDEETNANDMWESSITSQQDAIRWLIASDIARVLVVSNQIPAKFEKWMTSLLVVAVTLGYAVDNRSQDEG